MLADDMPMWQLERTLWQMYLLKIITSNIISLLEFCLKNSYFLFLGKYCEQLEKAVMGSPKSIMVTNLFMESFVTLAFAHLPTPQVCGKVHG